MPAGAAGAAGDGAPIRLANEFAEVVVDCVRTRNGARLRISVPSSGRQILLCPLELEALTWQEPEMFSRLLQTPHGPESQGCAGLGGTTPPDPPGWGDAPQTPG
jgi:hypothetical protein